MSRLNNVLIIHPGRTAATLSLALAGFACGSSRATPTTPSQVPFSTPTPLVLGQPDVVLLTSSNSCDGGADKIYDQLLELDRREIRSLFPNAVVSDGGFATEVSFGRNGGRPSGEAPVALLLYAGHGVSMEADSGEMETRLCFADGGRPFHSLAASIAKGHPKGVVLILDACDSGYVDPSISGDVPLSVISGAVDKVMAGLVDGGGTPIVDTVVSLLRDGGVDLDRNCDGYVTDEELFDALEGELRDRSWHALSVEHSDTASPVPVPKLRRNARHPLSIMSVQGVSTRCLHLLEEKRLVERELPNLAQTALDGRKDYFVLTDAHRTLFAKDECQGLPVATSQACIAFLDGGLVLLNPSPPITGHIESLKAIETLAQLSGESEIFEVGVDGQWIEVRRLRDGMIVAVTTVDHALDAVPTRDEIVQRTAKGPVFKRYGGRVCRERLAPFDPVAEPCRTGIGQCFWLKREPVGREDACDESK